MPDLLYLFGWNLFVTLLMAIAVRFACRTQMLSRRPAVCHGLWLLVLLKLVTPPIISLPLPSANVAQLQEHAAVVPVAMQSVKSGCSCSTPPINVSVATASQTGSTTSDSRETFIALLGISLFVTCALWIAAAWRVLQIRRLLRGSAVESGRAATLLREVARRFNSRTKVKLHVVDAPITPMLWAMPGNPAIVLPRQLVDSLSDDQLRNILAHEIGHFTRRDHWANLFSLVVTTLFWWNPLAWFARRQLSAAAETCCDAVALERLRASRKSYAKTLLTVVDSLTSAAPLRSPLGIAFGESKSLRRRFEMISDANVRASLTPRGWILLAIGFAALTLMPAQAQKDSKPAATASYGCETVPSQVSFPELCCPS